MKKLFTILCLVLLVSCSNKVPLFKDSLQCFGSSGTRMIDLNGIEIISYDLSGRNQYISYKKEDGGIGEVENISESTPCHITKPAERR